MQPPTTRDGNPLSLYGVGIDITARKQAQQAVADARLAAAADASRLNVALSAARLGDWQWEAATDMVTMSPHAAEIFGIPPGPHMTWAAMRELLHEDDRDRARIAVEQAIETHADYAIEYRVVHRHRERWISASGRASYRLTAPSPACMALCRTSRTTACWYGWTMSSAARRAGRHHLCRGALLGSTSTSIAAPTRSSRRTDTIPARRQLHHGAHSIVGRYRFQPVRRRMPAADARRRALRRPGQRARPAHG